MELLLILVVGGLAAWLMRPLRDWYVLEAQDGSGASPEKTVFSDLAAAQLAFEHTAAKGAQGEAAQELHLWHVEARSRREALKSEGRKPVLLTSGDPPPAEMPISSAAS